MIKICVGSKNPVKIASTREAFQLVFKGQEIICDGLNASSGVSDQPMSDRETLMGARNRAMYCSKQAEADYCIGIEGGLDIVEGQMLAFAWIFIMNGQKFGRAKTATFDLPPKLSALIRQGYELGEADDMVFNRKNSKQKDGAVGILTHGLIDRTAYYKEAVTLALIPFSNEDLF